MKPYEFARKLIRAEDCADEEAGHEAGAWLTREQLARTYDTKGDLLRSLNLPRRFKVLELGVRAGYSAEVFLACGARSYFGIDAANGTWWGPGPDAAELIGQAMIDLGERYPKRQISYMLADSHAVGTLNVARELGPYDLIHFDGDQFYAGASQDLNDYLPLLTPNGVAIVDGPPPFSGFDRAARDGARANGFVVTEGYTPFTVEAHNLTGNALRSYPHDLVLRRATEPEQVIVPGPALGIAA